MTHIRSANSLRALTLVCLAAALVGLGGCVHRIGIQQGNFLEQKDIDRVAVGMTRVQVRALLGTPMVADPFHQSRWDYYFYLKMGRWKEPMQRHFVVYFDGEDKVERVETRTGSKESDVSDELKEIAERTANAG
jgi:outer membrane protein assembly factor BamE